MAGKTRSCGAQAGDEAKARVILLLNNVLKIELKLVYDTKTDA
jgi:hypothetical protein